MNNDIPSIEKTAYTIIEDNNHSFFISYPVCIFSPRIEIPKDPNQLKKVLIENFNCEIINIRWDLSDLTYDEKIAFLLKKRKNYWPEIHDVAIIMEWLSDLKGLDRNVCIGGTGRLSLKDMTLHR